MIQRVKNSVRDFATPAQTGFRPRNIVGGHEGAWGHQVGRVIPSFFIRLRSVFG